MCEKFSLQVLCKNCLDSIPITPNIRVLNEGISVYSFYRYSDIDFLLKSKYYAIGSRILKLLSRRAALHFADKFIKMEGELFGVALDDAPRNFYSHTAVILREFREFFTPLYGALKAQNLVHYAGKDLAFRLANPRNFIYSNKAKKMAKTIVLVDDIITTGTSLNEAISVVKKDGVFVAFCLTLCDASK